MAWADEAKHEWRVQDASKPHITETKILSFKQLEDGWHYGEGEAFNGAIIEQAVKLHRIAIQQAFFITDAFPGLSGQIVVTIYINHHYLEFEIAADRTVALLQEVDGQEVAYQVGLSFEEAIESLRRLRKDIWKQSGSSARDTMMPEWAGSLAWHSGTPVGEPEESRSSTEGVSLRRKTACAAISDVSTKVLPANPPIFWQFSTEILPTCCRVEQQDSSTGDHCHYNILGLTDNQAKQILVEQTRNLANLCVCVANCENPLHKSDLES
jgi:hypothetical protein